MGIFCMEAPVGKKVDWSGYTSRILELQKKLAAIQIPKNKIINIPSSLSAPSRIRLRPALFTTDLPNPITDDALKRVFEVKRLVKVRQDIFREQQQKVQELDNLSQYVARICSAKREQQKKLESNSASDSYQKLLEWLEEEQQDEIRSDNTRELRRVMTMFSESALAAARVNHTNLQRFTKLLKNELKPFEDGAVST